MKNILLSSVVLLFAVVGNAQAEIYILGPQSLPSELESSTLIQTAQQTAPNDSTSKGAANTPPNENNAKIADFTLKLKGALEQNRNAKGGSGSDIAKNISAAFGNK